MCLRQVSCFDHRLDQHKTVQHAHAHTHTHTDTNNNNNNYPFIFSLLSRYVVVCFWCNTCTLRFISPFFRFYCPLLLLAFIRLSKWFWFDRFTLRLRLYLYAFDTTVCILCGERRVHRAQPTAKANNYKCIRSFWNQTTQFDNKPIQSERQENIPAIVKHKRVNTYFSIGLKAIRKSIASLQNSHTAKCSTAFRYYSIQPIAFGESISQSGKKSSKN